MLKLNKLIFPAPNPSYTREQLQGKIVYIPREAAAKPPPSFLPSSLEESKEEGAGSSTGGFFANLFSSRKKDPLPPIPCLYLREKTVGSSKLLLYFHGNAEDVGLSLRDLDILKKSLKINILAMEYRGYGVHVDADGCSADKIREDCDYVYNYLLRELHLKESDIIVFGRSIGTGPATFLSANNKPAAVILMSAYTSIRDIAKQQFKIVGGLMHSHFDNLKLIPKVTSPTFFIHGKMDDLILYQHSERLFEAIGAKQKFCHYPAHMTHNDFDYHDDII